MNLHKRLIAPFICSIAIGCGDASKDYQSGSPGDQFIDPERAGNTDQAREISFSVASSAALPTCDPNRDGALAYVSGEKKFYVCENSSWVATGIGENNEVKVTGRWVFHVDTYQGEPDVMEETLGLVKVGDIEIIRYSNDTARYFISGNMVDWDSGDTDIYSDNFSYNGEVTDIKQNYTKIFKFGSYSNMRLRVKINFSSQNPTVMIVGDMDGDLSDNADISFTMTPEAF